MLAWQGCDRSGLERLEETDNVNVKAKVRVKDKLVELHWTPDLERRFARFPAEVRPKDNFIRWVSALSFV